MSRTVYPLSAVLAVVLAGAGRADPPEVPVAEGTLTQLRADVGGLTRALEDLQESAVQDLGGRPERTLYRKADAALSGARVFRQALKEKVSRKRLWQAYDELDGRLQELRKAADGLGADFRALHREAARVEAAAEDLQYTLSAGMPPAPRRQRILERLARRLLTETRELERVARYALGDRAESAGDFRRLVEAASALRKGIDVRAGQEQLRKDYDRLSAAWQRAVAVVRQLKIDENLYLLRVAGRTDRTLGRLHLLLGIPGKRPALSLEA